MKLDDGVSFAEGGVTPTEERALMRFASDRMALAMSVCRLHELLPHGAAHVLRQVSTGARLAPSQVCAWTSIPMVGLRAEGWNHGQPRRAVRAGARVGF